MIHNDVNSHTYWNFVALLYLNCGVPSSVLTGSPPPPPPTFPFSPFAGCPLIIRKIDRRGEMYTDIHSSNIHVRISSNLCMTEFPEKQFEKSR